MFCGIPSSLFCYPASTTRTPQRTLDHHSPRSRQSADRGTLRASHFIPSPGRAYHTSAAVSQTLRSSPLSNRSVTNGQPHLPTRKIRQAPVTRHDSREPIESPAPPRSTNSRNSPLTKSDFHQPHPIPQDARASSVATNSTRCPKLPTSSKSTGSCPNLLTYNLSGPKANAIKKHGTAPTHLRRSTVRARWAPNQHGPRPTPRSRSQLSINL